MAAGLRVLVTARCPSVPVLTTSCCTRVARRGPAPGLVVDLPASASRLPGDRWDTGGRSLRAVRGGELDDHWC